MNEADDDAIEALLRADFEGPVEIGDFGDRVMAGLPRRRPHAWLPRAGILLGAVAGWLSLLSAPALRTGWRDLLDGAWAGAGVALVLTIGATSLLALAWAVMEGGESQAAARRQSHFQRR